MISARRLILIASTLPTVAYAVARVGADAGAPLPLDRLGTPILPDLANRLVAARLVLSGRSPLLYDLTAQRAELTAMLPSAPALERLGTQPSFEPFVAPPIDAILYVPIAGLPYLVAAGTWLAVTLGLLILAVRLLRPALPGLHRQGLAPDAILFGLSLPVFALLNNGQDTALSLLLLVVGFRLLRARRDAAAGIVLALGLFKPQIFGLIPIFFLVRRNWPALASWAVTALGLAALSIAMVGLDGAASYLRLLGSDQLGGMVARLGWQMTTLPALLRATFPGGATAPALLADGLLLFAYACRIGQLELPDGFALTIVVTVLATPYLFLYDSAVLLIPVTIALARQSRSSHPAWIVTAGYALLSTAVHRHALFGADPFPLSLLGAPWAVVPIAALAFVLGTASREAGPPSTSIKARTALHSAMKPTTCRDPH